MKLSDHFKTAYPRAEPKPTHADTIRLRIAELESLMCAQMYCDTPEEARLVAEKMRHEAYVVSLGAVRHEMNFLKLRLAAMVQA